MRLKVPTLKLRLGVSGDHPHPEPLYGPGPPSHHPSDEDSRFMLTGEVLGNVVVSRKFIKQFIFVCPPFPPQNPHRLMELVTARRKTVGRRGATFNLELWRSQPSYLLLTQNSYLLELKT